MADDEGEVRATLRFTGELTILLPDGEVRLTSLAVEAQGGLRAPTGRVALTLTGLLHEVRRLGSLSPALAGLLAHVKEESDGTRTASLTLVATPALVERLRAAGAGFEGEGEPMADALAENPAYAAALFDLLAYAPEKVSVVTATWTG